MDLSVKQFHFLLATPQKKLKLVISSNVLFYFVNIIFLFNDYNIVQIYSEGGAEYISHITLPFQNFNEHFPKGREIYPKQKPWEFPSTSEELKQQ